jgi:hypothetical protein
VSGERARAAASLEPGSSRRLTHDSGCHPGPSKPDQFRGMPEMALIMLALPPEAIGSADIVARTHYWGAHRKTARTGLAS